MNKNKMVVLGLALIVLGIALFWLLGDSPNQSQKETLPPVEGQVLDQDSPSERPRPAEISVITLEAMPDPSRVSQPVDTFDIPLRLRVLPDTPVKIERHLTFGGWSGEVSIQRDGGDAADYGPWQLQMPREALKAAFDSGKVLSLEIEGFALEAHRFQANEKAEDPSPQLRVFRRNAQAIRACQLVNAAFALDIPKGLNGSAQLKVEGAFGPMRAMPSFRKTLEIDLVRSESELSCELPLGEIRFELSSQTYPTLVVEKPASLKAEVAPEGVIPLVLRISQAFQLQVLPYDLEHFLKRMSLAHGREVGEDTEFEVTALSAGSPPTAVAKAKKFRLKDLQGSLPTQGNTLPFRVETTPEKVRLVATLGFGPFAEASIEVFGSEEITLVDLKAIRDLPPFEIHVKQQDGTAALGCQVSLRLYFGGLPYRSYTFSCDTSGRCMATGIPDRKGIEIGFSVAKPYEIEFGELRIQEEELTSPIELIVSNTGGRNLGVEFSGDSFSAKYILWRKDLSAVANSQFSTNKSPGYIYIPPLFDSSPTTIAFVVGGSLFLRDLNANQHEIELPELEQCRVELTGSETEDYYIVPADLPESLHILFRPGDAFSEFALSLRKTTTGQPVPLWFEPGTEYKAISGSKGMSTNSFRAVSGQEITFKPEFAPTCELTVRIDREALGNQGRLDVLATPVFEQSLSQFLINSEYARRIVVPEGVNSVQVPWAAEGEWVFVASNVSIKQIDIANERWARKQFIPRSGSATVTLPSK